MNKAIIKSHGNYFWQGILAGSPFILVVAPFALLFGAVATEAGLNLTQTMSMTVLVIAGASQFAAIQMLVEQAPTFVVLLTGLAINMRMALYSASMAPHIGQAPQYKRLLAAYFLVDQSYAASIRKFEDEPHLTTSQKLRYFFGTMVTICPLWYGFTYLGAIGGESIPPQYALDFAVPITFISLVAPSLRSIPHLSAAFISVTISLLLAWMPYNLWLLIAALLAMITGAFIEKFLAQNYD